MLLIDNQTVASVLNMADTITALEDAYTQHVKRESVCRPRIDIQIPTSDSERVYRWGTMEGGSMHGYFAIRMKSDVLFQQEYNGAITQEKFCVQPGTYCGLVLLMSVHNGEPLAFLNDGVLQQMRVGADGGIGVKYAARENCEVIGMLGSGGQARSHMASFMHVRPGIRRLQVYSPTRANCERFATEMHERYGIEAVACKTPEEVYRGADILAAITDSAVPVIDHALVEQGSHVINIGGGGYIGGGGTPGNTLLDRIDLYFRFGDITAPWGHPEYGVADEFLTWAAAPAGHPRSKLNHTGKRGHGHLLPDKMRTFADLVDQGLTTLRTGDDQISYSERGNLQGQQFWAVAGMVYEKVRAAGLGREIPTEWFLQDIRN